MNNNTEDQIYRANFKAKNGYDPGAYGEWDPITLAFVLFFLFKFLTSYSFS
jgi:hypothetical protein